MLIRPASPATEAADVDRFAEQGPDCRSLAAQRLAMWLQT
jgi:hypothetical protein